MTNLDSNVIAPSNDVSETVTAEEKVSRSMEQASMDRIQFHVDLSAQKFDRLSKLTEGTKAHARCLASIAKNDAFVAQLRSELADRLAKKSSNVAA